MEHEEHITVLSTKWKNLHSMLSFITRFTPVGYHSSLEACTPCRAQSAKVFASSLIPQTLEEMALDTDHQQLQDSLKRRGQAALTRDEKRKRQRSLEAIDAPPFHSLCLVNHGCTSLMLIVSTAF